VGLEIGWWMGLRFVLGAPWGKSFRSGEGLHWHLAPFPHISQRHKIIAAQDQRRKTQLHRSAAPACLRRAVDSRQQQPVNLRRACFFAETEKWPRLVWPVLFWCICTMLRCNSPSSSHPRLSRAGAPSSGLFCPPPERLSLRGCGGSPCKHPQVPSS